MAAHGWRLTDGGSRMFGLTVQVVRVMNESPHGEERYWELEAHHFIVEKKFLRM